MGNGCEVIEAKVKNDKNFSEVILKIFMNNIPSSNIRLIPQRGFKRFTLSYSYRLIRDALKKEVKKALEGKKIKVNDWAKGVLNLIHFRKGKGFTRDIDNFLKIIIDGVFSALGLNDKALRILNVSLREVDYVVPKSRKKNFGTWVFLKLCFFKKNLLDKALEAYERFKMG